MPVRRDISGKIIEETSKGGAARGEPTDLRGSLFAASASATGIRPRSTRAGYSGLSRWLLGLGVVLLIGAVDVAKGAGDESRLAGEMVTIPGGTFGMGDWSGTYDDELPVHRVTVASFELGKYEVAFSQWDACVADAGCLHRPLDEGWGRGNRPVMNVSWDHIQEFIAWLNAKTGGGYRLPTESEWEYAARAGSVTEYSWGDNIREDGGIWANCQNSVCGDSWDNTAPVGSFASNAWGLHDMHGNVYEWVQDCWNNHYKGAPVDGSAWESEDCSQRVIRGGSWFSYSWTLRSADRSRGGRPNRYLYLGFRLARDK